MQIARGLQRLRDRAELTQAQLAARSGVGKATIGRYEEWRDRRRVKWATVRALCDSCGATPEERDTLVQLARRQGEGWWMGHPAVPEWMDPILSFETVGEYEHVYSSGLVSGLLQTRAYALALHRAQLVDAEEDEIQQKVDLRMQRQDEILHRTSPPFRLWVVLDESVLHREVGGREVMADQLAHMANLAQRPGVELQILPYRSGAHAVGAGQPFLICGRDDERNPLNSVAIVYLEMHNRGIYLDDPDDITEYKNIFRYLHAQAASPHDTLDTLNAVQQEYQ